MWFGGVLSGSTVGHTRHEVVPYGGDMAKWLYRIVTACLCMMGAAFGQEMHHHSMEPEHHSMAMHGLVLLTDSMTQEGSGTTWIPATTPMHAYHFMLGESWQAMIHGVLDLRYIR